METGEIFKDPEEEQRGVRQGGTDSELERYLAEQRAIAAQAPPELRRKVSSPVENRVDKEVPEEFDPGSYSEKEVPSERPAKASQPVDPLIGEVVGGLEITEKIGEGGQGRVYRGISKTGKTVVLKLLQDEKEGDAPGRKVSLEVKVAQKLKHPNILGIDNAGEHGEFYWLQMRDLGDNAALDVRKERPFEEKINLMYQLAQAMAHAHEEGVLHRDLKPSNILIDKEGIPYLTDFGTGCIVEDGESLQKSLQRSLQTIEGAKGIVGTVEYMAPEQKEPNGKVDERTDVYALSKVFYELLTGEKPDVRAEKRLVQARVPKEIAEIVLRGLDNDKEQRPRDIQEIVKVIEDYLERKSKGISSEKGEISLQKLIDNLSEYHDSEKYVKHLATEMAKALESDFNDIYRVVMSLKGNVFQEAELSELDGKGVSVSMDHHLDSRGMPPCYIAAVMKREGKKLAVRLYSRGGSGDFTVYKASQEKEARGHSGERKRLRELLSLPPRLEKGISELINNLIKKENPSSVQHILEQQLRLKEYIFRMLESKGFDPEGILAAYEKGGNVEVSGRVILETLDVVPIDLEEKLRSYNKFLKEDEAGQFILEGIRRRLPNQDSYIIVKVPLTRWKRFLRKHLLKTYIDYTLRDTRTDEDVLEFYSGVYTDLDIPARPEVTIKREDTNLVEAVKKIGKTIPDSFHHIKYDFEKREWNARWLS